MIYINCMIKNLAKGNPSAEQHGMVYRNKQLRMINYCPAKTGYDQQSLPSPGDPEYESGADFQS